METVAAGSIMAPWWFWSDIPPQGLGFATRDPEERRRFNFDGASAKLLEVRAEKRWLRACFIDMKTMGADEETLAPIVAEQKAILAEVRRLKRIVAANAPVLVSDGGLV